MSKVHKTRALILRAARSVLLEKGYATLSIRRVAAAADVPMSQIQYHFGSKQGLIIELFVDMNNQLLDRQKTMFGDPDLTLSQQWALACDYLDEDLESGYVRILQELWAAGWSNPEIAEVVRAGMSHWFELLTDVVRRLEIEIGSLGPFDARDIASLVSSSFIGAESFILLGFENKSRPVRQSLRKVGDLIVQIERGAL